MADVRSLDAFRKAKRKQKASAQTLCKNGHHKWKTDKETVFDSQKGKLVTRQVCERCGKVQVTAR